MLALRCRAVVNNHFSSLRQQFETQRWQKGTHCFQRIIPSSSSRNNTKMLQKNNAHISLMAVYNSSVGWDRTSACPRATGSRYQSIFDLAHPSNPRVNVKDSRKGLSFKSAYFYNRKDFHLYASTEDPQSIVITFPKNTSKLHLRGTVLNRID